MSKKLWILLALAVLVSAIWCGAAVAASSGSCGENATYTLTDDGILIISGSGNMDDFMNNVGMAEKDTIPWYSQRSSIKTIVILEGITKIGGYAFIDCSNLTNVTIPASVTCIGKQAFSF